jgi:hypothetical protein|tara:strand:+ start:113 stop:319 length:207 start_codon:yes stop_codon:yes gene_type:complete
MSKETYTKELRKDISIIKKDLRAISIKTRIIARELEIDEENKKTTGKKKQSSWWVILVKKVKSWLGRK